MSNALPYLGGSRLAGFDLIVKSDFGGLGDFIGRLPAFKAAVDRHPQVRRLVIFHFDFFLPYAERVLKHDRIEHRAMSGFEAWVEELKKGKQPNHPFISFKPPASALKIHLSELGWIKVHDEIPTDKRLLEYLPTPTVKRKTIAKRYQLPNKYVVVTTGYTAKVRAWPAAEVNKVINWCAERELLPVFLGKKEQDTGAGAIPDEDIKASFQDEIEYGKGLDLRNKTNLLDAANIMRYAQAVVGVDNGLLHLSATTPVKSVWGFTTVDPKHRMPYRGGVMGKDMLVVTQPKSLACRFCQSRMHFVYGHDFRECFYGNKQNFEAARLTPTPYACTFNMRGEYFIEALKRLGVGQ